MEIPNTLLTQFTARIKDGQDSYVIEIPQRELDIGGLESGTVYRIAVLSQASQTAVTKPSQTTQSQPVESEPPVEEGDEVDVEIENLGDQGDGIARIGDGYVVIVPGTDVGNRVTVEITEPRENVAFAEVIEGPF